MSLEKLEALEQIVADLNANNTLLEDWKDEMRYANKIVPDLPHWEAINLRLKELERLNSSAESITKIILDAKRKDLMDTSKSLLEDEVEEVDELSELTNRISQHVNERVQEALLSGEAQKICIEVELPQRQVTAATLH